MIYVDSENRCHAADPEGIFREVDHPFFYGKCASFIEGYCYDDSKGYVQIYPWKPSAELTAAQAQYEAMLADMDDAYAEGVASA